VGKSELEFHHARTIVLIRRKLEWTQSVNDFWRMWREEDVFLLRNLDSRWLISACDTIVDISNDQEMRAAAAAATLFANTCKLYETERLMKTSLESVDTEKSGDRVELYDGLTAFVVGRGDMVHNLFARVGTLNDGCVANKILKEVMNRARQNDTVFRRFGDIHEVEHTRW
jgi:hypothetical protein